jgi:hypothetical protein
METLKNLNNNNNQVSRQTETSFGSSIEKVIIVSKNMHPNMKAKEILWGVIAANIHIMKNFRNYA